MSWGIPWLKSLLSSYLNKNVKSQVGQHFKVFYREVRKSIFFFWLKSVPCPSILFWLSCSKKKVQKWHQLFFLPNYLLIPWAFLSNSIDWGNSIPCWKMHGSIADMAYILIRGRETATDGRLKIEQAQLLQGCKVTCKRSLVPWCLTALRGFCLLK